MVFSIELGIKAILAATSNAPRGHDLLILFGLLPPPIQEEIIVACKLPQDGFYSELASAAKLFEEWRYIYEMEEPKINLPFVQSLANAVYFATEAHAE